MEIQQLKGFISVAKSGSFSKAALKTFRTQPAVTLQVQALEKELGVKLFERIGTRKLALTPEGKAFYELVSPLAADLESLKTRFDEMRGKTQNLPVRIATHSSIVINILPEIIKDFKKSWPDAELSVLNRGRQEILSMLKDGEIDLGITSLKAVPANMDYKVFARLSRVLVLSRKHPLAGKKHITLKDMAAFPLILPPRGSNTREAVNAAFEKAALTPKIAMELTSHMAAKTYVEMGMGITILNESYLGKEDGKKFSIIDVSDLFGKSERGVITRKGAYLSKPAGEMIRLICR